MGVVRSGNREQLRDALYGGGDAAMGGFGRREYIEELCTYIKERVESRGRRLPSEIESAPGKGSKLKPFVNYTKTTSLNRCAFLVVVPNRGLAEAVAGGLLFGKKCADEDPGHKDFLGDPDDDFRTGLKISNGEIREAGMYSSDIILSTTKALLEMDNHKVDLSKCFIEDGKQLQNIDTKVKLELGIYAFLSGVSECIFMDADLLQIQNLPAISKVIHIVLNAKPKTQGALNLKSLSSGEDRKRLLFLSDTVTSEIRAIYGKYSPSDASILLGPNQELPLMLGNRGQANSFAFQMFMLAPRDSPQGKVQAFNDLFEFHVSTISKNSGSFIVLVKDSLYAVALKDHLRGHSLMGPTGMLFIDEYTSRNKIKAEQSSNTKRIWVVTERFVFYQRKRLARLLGPLNAQRLLLMHAPDPHLLCLLLPLVDRNSPESPGPYGARVILQVFPGDKFVIERILGRKFSLKKEFQFADHVKFPITFRT